MHRDSWRKRIQMKREPFAITQESVRPETDGFGTLSITHIEERISIHKKQSIELQAVVDPAM